MNSKVKMVVVLLILITGVTVLGQLFLKNFWLSEINDTQEDGNKDTEKLAQFAWYYPSYTNESTDIINRVQQLKFTDLFFSIDAKKLYVNSSQYDQTYTQSVTDFVQTANTNDIGISFMTLESALFYNNSNAAKQHLFGIEAFLSENNAKISGIHFDIEPHTLDAWDNESNQIYIFQEFVDTLIELGKYISNSTILSKLDISIAVPWWYNEKNYDDRYPSRLTKYYDYLVFMLYGGIGNEIDDYQRVEDELSTINGLLGYGFQEFGNQSATLEFKTKLEHRYRDNPKVIGTSLFKLNNLL